MARCRVSCQATAEGAWQDKVCVGSIRVLPVSVAWQVVHPTSNAHLTAHLCVCSVTCCCSWCVFLLQVVAQAGLPSSVTIATNMAGRGTDIILGGNPEGLTRMALKRYILRCDTHTPRLLRRAAAAAVVVGGCV